MAASRLRPASRSARRGIHIHADNRYGYAHARPTYLALRALAAAVFAAARAKTTEDLAIGLNLRRRTGSTTLHPAPSTQHTSTKPRERYARRRHGGVGGYTVPTTHRANEATAGGRKGFRRGPSSQKRDRVVEHAGLSQTPPPPVLIKKCDAHAGRVVVVVGGRRESRRT